MSVTTIFENQQISGFAVNDLYGMYYAYIAPPPFSLVAGETYRVVWDNDEYVCTAVDASAMIAGMVVIGNLAEFGFTGNNEPFIIGTNSADANFFVTNPEDTRETHNVAIYQGTTE